MRRLYGVVAMVAVGAVGTALLTGTPAAANSPHRSVAANAVDASTAGESRNTAAGSCWEIKQLRSDAPDGVYWLVTPTMSEPARFYCDMTTDGGGWVLIAKGRSAWTTDYAGKGAASNLRTPDTTPMKARTVQYPSSVIDDLLGGARVDDLDDGVRLRRATNTSGTSWQEVRMSFANRDRWAWSFGAGHPLASYSFDGWDRDGGATDEFGVDTSHRQVVTTNLRDQGYRWGFAYGRSARGSSADDSYVWSRTNGAGHAMPYTQMYVRPKVTSDDPGFQAIPNSGTAKVTQAAVAASTALDSPWGVSGLAGSTSREGNVEVQAFAEGDGVMYVGGNFRYVQKGPDSSGSDKVEQSFLAAFDVETGEFIRTFTPDLNEQVKALAVLPNGNVVAGGDFSNANGDAATAIVALDPETGATVNGWSVDVENRLSSGVLRINSLSLHGQWLYLGGAFTHLSGGSRPNVSVYMRGAARVSAADGTPGRNWNPEFNGTVMAGDPSADGARYYAAGYFGRSQGVDADRAAAVETSDGAALVSWAHDWSSNNKNYQQAIDEVGDRVWVGGSEHSLFSFATDGLERLSSNITIQGGDFQALATDGDVVYAGCHCNNWNYSGADSWPNPGNDWTQGDAIGWFGAWDAHTGEMIPAFTPSMQARLGSGVWALAVDSSGTVWAGGDIRAGTTTNGGGQWIGGFARFGPVDSSAPAKPSNLRVVDERADSVKLRWDPSPNADASDRYQILRDDRTVARTGAIRLWVPKGGQNRFFVRTVDTAGNVSASTNVRVAN